MDTDRPKKQGRRVISRAVVSSRRFVEIVVVKNAEE